MMAKAVKTNTEQGLSIPELKAGDFQEQTGIVPKEYTRSVKVNDFTTNILVKLKLNHKKNSYEVDSRILWSQVSEDPHVMLAVFQAKYALEMHAIKQGEKWRKQRIKEEQDEHDDDQMEMDLEMGFTDEEVAVPQEADAD